MEIEEFTEIVAEFQSSLRPFKARVLNPDPHGEGGRKSVGLTHLSILVTLRECAETAWRHFWESETKAMNVFQRINYETLLDHESNTLEFCKKWCFISLKGLRSLLIIMSERSSSWMMNLAQCSRLWVIVTQLISLSIYFEVISNPSPETSAMFPDYPEKDSGHLLNLKPKFHMPRS